MRKSKKLMNSNLEETLSIHYKFICNAEPGVEYYTKNSPTTDWMGNKFTFTDCFLKQKKEKTVGKEIISCFYSTFINSYSVNLNEGIYFVVVDSIETEEWINTTEEDADKKIREKVLIVYENLIPNLIENMNELKNENEHLKDNLKSKLEIINDLREKKIQNKNGLIDL